MIRKATVYTIDRKEAQEAWDAWKKIKPFIPKSCDPKITKIVDDAIFSLWCQTAEDDWQ